MAILDKQKYVTTAAVVYVCHTHIYATHRVYSLFIDMSCVTAILAQNSATAQADLHFIYNGKSPWQPGEVNPKKKKEYLFCDVIFLHSQKHTVSRNKWLKKSNAIKNVHKIRNILRIRLYSRSQIWFGVKFKNGENSPADLFIVFIIYLLVCLFINSR